MNREQTGMIGTPTMFPAGAGMNRNQISPQIHVENVPRRRGDEPGLCGFFKGVD